MMYNDVQCAMIYTGVHLVYNADIIGLGLHSILVVKHRWLMLNILNILPVGSLYRYGLFRLANISNQHTIILEILELDSNVLEFIAGEKQTVNLF